MARKQPTNIADQLATLAKGCRSITVDGAEWIPADVPDVEDSQRRKGQFVKKIVPDLELAAKIAARPPTGCEICVTMRCKTAGMNKREHWACRARRVKDEHEELGLLLAAHTMKREHLVPGCVVRMCRIGKRVDDDNLRGHMKAIRDYVAFWLLGGRMGERDSDERITWEYDQQYLGPKVFGVVVSISPRATP